jgi:hypothetical protein
MTSFGVADHPENRDNRKVIILKSLGNAQNLHKTGPK